MRPTVFALASVVILALILAGPAVAQETGTVTVTFELTSNGTPLADENLSVRYKPGDDRSNVLLFCGIANENFPDAERCVGKGAVYSVEGEAPEGATIQFRLSRHNDNVRPVITKTFARGSETFLSDTTVTAYYNFDTEQGGLGQDLSVPDVPDTGAGGAASGTLPVGETVAALSLLAAGGYVMRRWQATTIPISRCGHAWSERCRPRNR